MATASGGGSAAPGGTLGMKDIFTAVVAVLAVLAFGAFVVFLMRNMLAVDEPQWSRAIYLYGGVEAIAFAAAGYLFGREVNRAQATQAEKRADAAEQKADANQQAAANGRALAAMIQARAATRPGPVSGPGGLAPSGPSGSPAPSSLQDLADVAHQMFP